MKSPLSLIILACAGALPLQAAIVATTGFESPGYVLGNLTTGTTPVSASAANAGAVILNDTTATPFGSGNQFLAMNGNTAQFTVQAIGVTELSTFSFDFYEPGGAGAQTGTLNFGLGLGNTGDLNGTGGYSVWTIGNGVIGLGGNTSTGNSQTNLSVGRAYRAFVLYNGSSVTQNFAIPNSVDPGSLGADQTALFFYDTVTGTYIDQGRFTSAKANDPTAPNVFKFRAFSSSKNEIYIDNFTRDNTLTLAIPEPSVAAFGLLALAGAFRRRRPLD